MGKRLLFMAVCGSIVVAGVAGLTAQEPAEDGVLPVELRSLVRSLGRPSEQRKLQDFNELTKGTKTYEGFITLHEKDQHLYAEIKPSSWSSRSWRRW